MRTLLLLAALLLSACTPPEVPEPPQPPTPPTTPPANIGYATYAIQSEYFPCTAFINSLAKEDAYAISWLWNTFGSTTDCLKKTLSDPRLTGVQVHLTNEVCVRNENCGSYELLDGLSVSRHNALVDKEEGWLRVRYENHTRALMDFLSTYIELRPDISCTVSPGLESNLTTANMEKVIDWIKPQLHPRCTITHNALLPSARRAANADFFEHHDIQTALTPPCIFDNDGRDITFPGVPTTYPRTMNYTEIPRIYNQFKNCSTVFFWVKDYNCIEDSFKDPRVRKCRNTATIPLLGPEVSALK